jgi:acetyl esterase
MSDSLKTPPFDFEPETARFVESVANGSPTENLTIEQLRDGYRETVIANSVPSLSSVTTSDEQVETANGPIMLRVYTPERIAGQISGLLVYVHGGGFAVGDLESHDNLLRLIAHEAENRVLAIDYRRALEYPFPAARDDVLGCLDWAIANAERLNIDKAKIALGGESAGGTHAVAAAVNISATHPNALRALWVFVPALDPTGAGESHTIFATGAGRTASEFAYLWSLYLPDESLRKLPESAPAFDDASVLPTTFIYTAEFDPARDDGENFAAKAKAAGVDVRLKRQAGLVHQFPEITGISPSSRQAVVDAAKDLKAILG